MSVHGKHTENAGYQPGNHWNTCQRCGFDVRLSDTEEEWNGLKVCSKCWEPRHELDFVKAHPEDTSAKGIVTSDPTPSHGILTNQDNTAPTLTHGTDTNIHDWNTDLTANRIVTLANASEDDSFTIFRTGGGAYTLDIQNASAASIKIIPASVSAKAVFIYRPSGWTLDTYQTL